MPGYPKQTHWTVGNAAVITVSTATGNFGGGNRFETAIIVRRYDAGEEIPTEVYTRARTSDRADIIHAVVNKRVREAIAAGLSVDDIYENVMSNADGY